MKLLILGTGALATLFANRLSAAGAEVTLLGSWAEGLTALNHAGAQLEGTSGFRVHASNDPADCLGMEYALVLVKSRQTQRAASQLAECIAPHGMAISLQNGLGNETALAEALGGERVFQGVTTLGATLLAPGLVRLCGEGAVTLPSGPRLIPLIDLLKQAGFDVQSVDDIQPLVWGKLVINAAINPLTALLRVKNGLLLDAPSARQVMGSLANEAAAAAQACGIRLPFEDPAGTVEQVARETARNSSSMLQDVLRGVETEVDAINGAVVQRGEEKGLAMPVNRLVWSLVKAIPVRGNI